MTFAFHAAGPPGEWVNDPNALLYRNGRYHLYMQHCEAPEPKDIGWSRATSDDLLTWSWEGVAVPATERGSAYSGSAVLEAGELELFLTRHDPTTGIETQHRLSERQGRWLEEGHIGPSGRNRRDPFVFWNEGTGDWRMLVAAPCDWTHWSEDPASALEIWRSDDRARWTHAGSVGPWHPPGIMWEVPVLVNMEGRSALIVSMVDRRDGEAKCSVRYWPGIVSCGFSPDPHCPAEGLPLDLGPDFYAAVVSTPGNWPLPVPCLVAWASSWQWARSVDWPEGIRGGPITLPRALSWSGGRLRQRPIEAALGRSYWAGRCGPEAQLQISDGSTCVVVRCRADGAVEVRREGRMDWYCNYGPGTLTPGVERDCRLFRDGPLHELFIEPDGVTVTFALLGGERTTIEVF